MQPVNVTRIQYTYSRRDGGTGYGQIIRSGMESDESVMAGVTPDDDADNQSFQRDDGMDETYGDDILTPHGREAGNPS